MEQAEEAAAEAEAERDRAFRLVGERRVVEVELLEGVAQERVVLAAHRVEPGEHQRLRLPVAGQRLRGRARGHRDRVADLGIADDLEPGGDVADLAGLEALDRHELRPEDAELEELRLRAVGHEPDRLVVVERALRRGGRRRRRPCRGRSASRRSGPGAGLAGSPLGGGTRCDDRLEDLGHAGAVLGRGEDDLLARDREDVLELLDHELGLGRRQVDLVDDRDDRQILLEREVDVGDRLRLDALGGVDDEDRALARLRGCGSPRRRSRRGRACRSG